MTPEQRDEAEKIAKGLSEAQRFALKAVRPLLSKNAHDDLSAIGLLALRSYDQRGRPKFARRTPLGKRVAAVIGE